LLHGFYKFPLS